MIGIIFSRNDEVVEVRVSGNTLYFKNNQHSSGAVPIEGLMLSKEGVIREFPDLEGNDNWRLEAISRLKTKIKSFKTNNEKADYIIREMVKFGFVPKYYQEQGKRPRRIT